MTDMLARLIGAGLALAFAGGPAPAADTSKQLVGKTATMTIEVDPEAEIDKVLGDLGFSAIQPPRSLAADRFAAHRLEVLAGGPDNSGETTIVVWRLEKPIDKLKAEWRVVGAFRAKVGSESAFSDACPGNAKDKPALTFVFHEGGQVGQAAKNILASFRLDRQTGKIERLAGKPPACKAIEEPYEG